MKSYTDIEQSRKLAEILPIESADMRYIPIMDIDSMSNSGFLEIPECYPYSDTINWHADYLPCWSLAALLNVLPNENMLVKTTHGEYYYLAKDVMTKHYDNPIDACYEMILKLHELNLL